MGAGVWRAVQTTAKGLKPPRQRSRPGSLNPGAALESDGMVKLLNTRKHRHQEQAKEADQGLDQNGTRSGSGSRTWPDANDAPPVYRVDLTRPVVDAEHGKAVSVIPPWPAQGKPTARQAQGKRHGEDRTSQGRPVMERICPRRSGLSLSENRWNRTY
jgi:hypothetical protein